MELDRFRARRQEQIKIKLTDILKQTQSMSSLNDVTITKVILDRSMEHATVFYVPFPGQAQQFAAEIKTKLSAIRAKLVKAMPIKKIPILTFKYDTGLDHADKIDNIIKSLKR